MSESIPATVAQETRRRATLERKRGSPKQPRQPAYGKIVEQRLVVTEAGTKILQVRVNLNNFHSAKHQGSRLWYRVGYPTDYIALVYGDNLVGRYCRVEYNTVSATTGTVYIASGGGFSNDLDKATSIAAIGTIFSPAGSV